MRSIILLLYLSICHPCLSNELPQDSALLLEKLAEFEQNEHQRFKEAIMSKRVQVAKLLEEHLKRETKSGNLEEALLLKSEVQRLTAEDDPELGHEQPSTTLMNSLVGTEWLGVHPERNTNFSIIFLSDKALEWNSGTLSKARIWNPRSKNRIEIGDSDNHLNTPFDDDFSEGTGILTLPSGQEVILTLKPGANKSE